MMMRRLPPFNSFRFFESVARNLSFIRAADELCVTHGAVSKQIKLMEEKLGVKLFERSTNKVSLTPEARALLPEIRSALDIINNAVNSLDDDEHHGELVLSVPPAFASTWLLYRLPKFIEKYPKIKIKLLTSMDVNDVYESNYDVCIRWGEPKWKDREVTLLKSVNLFPVCSPKLLHSAAGLKSAECLKQHLLLSDDGGASWLRWLSAASINCTGWDEYMEIPSAMHLMTAAKVGMGVAMGDNITCVDDLRSGALIQPFDLSIESPSAYYLITGMRDQLPVRSKVFIDWLVEQIKSPVV